MSAALIVFSKFQNSCTYNVEGIWAKQQN